MMNLSESSAHAQSPVCCVCVLPAPPQLFDSLKLSIREICGWRLEGSVGASPTKSSTAGQSTYVYLPEIDNIPCCFLLQRGGGMPSTVTHSEEGDFVCLSCPDAKSTFLSLQLKGEWKSVQTYDWMHPHPCGQPAWSVSRACVLCHPQHRHLPWRLRGQCTAGLPPPTRLGSLVCPLPRRRESAAGRPCGSGCHVRGAPRGGTLL